MPKGIIFAVYIPVDPVLLTPLHSWCCGCSIPGTGQSKEQYSKALGNLY